MRTGVQQAIHDYISTGINIGVTSDKVINPPMTEDIETRNDKSKNGIKKNTA